MRSLKNRSETLSCKIWFLEHTKIRLNPKDEPPISKIERVTWIFVTGAEAKSQCCLIFKSQNLTQFLIFLPNFLHGSSISIEVKSLNSILGALRVPPPSPGSTDLSQRPDLRGLKCVNGFQRKNLNGMSKYFQFLPKTIILNKCPRLWFSR